MICNSNNQFLQGCDANTGLVIGFFASFEPFTNMYVDLDTLATMQAKIQAGTHFFISADMITQNADTPVTETQLFAKTVHLHTNGGVNMYKIGSPPKLLMDSLAGFRNAVIYVIPVTKNRYFIGTTTADNKVKAIKMYATPSVSPQTETTLKYAEIGLQIADPDYANDNHAYHQVESYDPFIDLKSLVGVKVTETTGSVHTATKLYVNVSTMYSGISTDNTRLGAPIKVLVAADFVATGDVAGNITVSSALHIADGKYELTVPTMVTQEVTVALKDPSIMTTKNFIGLSSAVFTVTIP